ncbi:MAG: hypothetical protein MJ103_04750, partial [Saccharofermentans sp.]|nr:hypothetical protein [Saccharofermentans sp.]
RKAKSFITRALVLMISALLYIQRIIYGNISEVLLFWGGIIPLIETIIITVAYLSKTKSESIYVLSSWHLL